MLDLAWERRSGATVEARYRTMQDASYTGGQYRRAHDLMLSLSQPWHGMDVGGSVEGGRDVFGANYSRVAGFVRFGGPTGSGGSHADGFHADASDEASDGAASDEITPSKIERFVDIGMKVGHLKYEYDVGGVPPVTHRMGSAHLAFGVRRAFNRHVDFGTRLELDNVRGRLLLAVRAVDFRYRLTPNFAPTLFFGAARYAGPTPALGWYAGAGLQWRNVMPKWDLAIDLNYGDKLQRDKVAPGESPGIWKNAYYNLTSETIYLSRRF